MLLINYLIKSRSLLLVLLFLSFGFLSQAQEKEEKTYIKTTVKGTTYEIVGWDENMVYNPYTFTWLSWEDPIIRKKTTTKQKMIPVSEFDRPPVFTGNGDCLAVEDKFACSNNELKDYISDQFIDYPEQAENRGQEGLEYVTFTLDEDGNFEGNLKVVSKEKPCKGCADAAVDIVASMEDKWFPAIKDGRTVKTELTIPIRFELLDK